MNGSSFVVLILMLIIIPMLIYGVLSELYLKHILHYDREKIEQVCTYAKRGIYSCEDLIYAGKYCSSAMEVACSQCGENCTAIMLS